MKKQKLKKRDPIAKNLQNKIFRQRIVESKKKKIKQFNWKKSNEDYLSVRLFNLYI